MASDQRNIKIIQAQKGFQERFVSSNVDVCFGGGVLNCGKSFAEVLSTAEMTPDPNFRACFVRKSFTEISQGGGIFDEFQKIFGNNATYTKTQPPRVTFPSGAFVEFRQVNNEDIKKITEEWKGTQYTTIVVDEATSIQFSTFKYLLTRNRSNSDFHPTFKATMNPDRNSWIRVFIDRYVAPDGTIRADMDGVVSYFYIYGDTVEDVAWGDTKEEVYLQCKEDIDKKLRALGGDFTYENMIKSFVFYLGKMSENKASIGRNMDYAGSVASVGGAQAKQLIEGNWNVSIESDALLPIKPANARRVASNDSQSNGTYWITADLADIGDDFLCILVWNGFDIIDAQFIGKTTPRQNAEYIIRVATQYDIADNHIIYDGNRAPYMLDYIPDAQCFISTYAPRGKYRRDFQLLKDEVYMRLVMAINDGRISMTENVAKKMYNHVNLKNPITFENEFVEECGVVQFYVTPNGKKRLYSKKDMNAKLGKSRSMDVLDACAIRFFPTLQCEYGQELELSSNSSDEGLENSSENCNVYDETFWC